MNLHAIVSGPIGAVNPHVTGSVLISTGNTTGANGKQVPTYAAPYNARIQLQPLTANDLKQMDALNLQGASRAMYIDGALAGVNRADVKGGDLVTLSSAAPLGLADTLWLVVGTIEPWNTAGWCKVGVQQQVVPE